MQTPCQVVDCLLRGKPADRVALMDSPWGDTLRKWTKQGYPTNDQGNPVDAVTHFDFDLAGCGGWFDWHPLQGHTEVEEETEDWIVRWNGSGAAFKYWKNKSGTPEHIDFRMTSREIWERDYRPHLPGTAEERTSPRLDNTRNALKNRREQQRWTHYGHQFLWECMRGSMGDVCLYESMLLDPGWIRDYGRVYTDLFRECFRLLIEEAGRPDGIWLYEDLGYKERLFCAPDVYADLIFPFYAEMVDFFHSYDLPVVFHTCGYTEPIIDLIVEAGFDGLNPMEVKAGNDPLRIAERYAEKLCFIGGLDARVLESSDRDLIRREITRLVEGMKARNARFVYASDHSLSTNVDYDDFRFAIDVYREHMKY